MRELGGGCIVADNVVRHYKLSHLGVPADNGEKTLLSRGDASLWRLVSDATRAAGQRSSVEFRVNQKWNCTLQRDQKTGSSHNKRVGIPFQTILPNLQSVPARAKRR